MGNVPFEVKSQWFSRAKADSQSCTYIILSMLGIGGGTPCLLLTFNTTLFYVRVWLCELARSDVVNLQQGPVPLVQCMLCWNIVQYQLRASDKSDWLLHCLPCPIAAVVPRSCLRRQVACLFVAHMETLKYRCRVWMQVAPPGVYRDISYQVKQLIALADHYQQLVTINLVFCSLGVCVADTVGCV